MTGFLRTTLGARRQQCGVICKVLKENKFEARILYQNYALNL